MLPLLLAATLHLLPPVLVEGERGWPLEERMRHYGATHVGIAVWRDGRIVWTREPDTRFQAGSISKTLTSVAVQRVLARESVPLSTDINTLLRRGISMRGRIAAKSRSSGSSATRRG
ncbi:MAG TPA: serine hydrolase [Thermoanaerobaculia bacterium]|nr:serine hydrolase [Thermoanaerobaculia bacterium]